MQAPFTIVSFYTIGTDYEAEAQRLIESCERFNLPYRVEPVPNLGTWQRNTQHKAEFLRWMRSELTGPIVWLDADAEVKCYPALFAEITDADVAVHYRAKGKGKRELLSGTVWFAETVEARNLLDRWVETNRRNPKRWDQSTLADAIRDLPGVLVHELPAPYCLIFDRMRRLGPPVILHHQASRRLKRRVAENREAVTA